MSSFHLSGVTMPNRRCCALPSEYDPQSLGCPDGTAVYQYKRYSGVPKCQIPASSLVIWYESSWIRPIGKHGNTRKRIHTSARRRLGMHPIRIPLRPPPPAPDRSAAAADTARIDDPHARTPIRHVPVYPHARRDEASCRSGNDHVGYLCPPGRRCGLQCGGLALNGCAINSRVSNSAVINSPISNGAALYSPAPDIAPFIRLSRARR